LRLKKLADFLAVGPVSIVAFVRQAGGGFTFYSGWSVHFLTSHCLLQVFEFFLPNYKVPSYKVPAAELQSTTATV
jgi:hypothetical protein